MPASRSEKADRLSVFPVFMKVENRFALVVGNGAEALNKARLLMESSIVVRLVSPAPSRELGAFIIVSDVDHVARPFSAEMVEGAVLVFAATGDADQDRVIHAAARAANVPVNTVDRPELCDFYTPALVNRAPVCVAIGSEGAGPVLTQIIRGRVEALLPASTGLLARLARRYRGAVEKLVPRGAARRRFWREFFSGGIARSIEDGRIAEARRIATRLMRGPHEDAAFVSFVGAVADKPDLMTLAGQRALQEADVIVHDADIGGAVIALGRRDARRIVAGADAVAMLIAEAAQDSRIVRLHVAGADISAEIAVLGAGKIAFDAVPGVTVSQTVRSSRARAA